MLIILNLPSNLFIFYILVRQDEIKYLKIYGFRCMIAQRFVKRGCVWSFAAIMLLHGAANAAHAGAEMSWSRPHSWNSIRNEGVARQSLDMSCGAAALATLLTHYHGANVTERDVLRVVGLNADYSLTDLANAAAAFGFRSAALSVDIGALERRAGNTVHGRKARRAFCRSARSPSIWRGLCAG